MSRKKAAPKFWRKLYMQEPADFSELSVYTRGLAAMLLKKADDSGLLVSEGEDMIERLARRLGASRGDRRRMPDDIRDLIADGYLVVQNGGLYIRNMAAFQGASDDTAQPTKGGAMRRRQAKRTDDCLTSVSHVSDDYLTSVSRVSYECLTSNDDLSARNHSDEEPKKAPLREEKRRVDGEEAPKAPTRSLPATTPEPVRSETSAPPADPPPSDPKPSPTAEPFLAVLRSHPDLAGVAKPAVADRVARNSAGKYKLEDFARGCADIVRKLTADRDIGQAWTDSRINSALERFAETAFRDRLDGRTTARQGQAVPVITSPPKPTAGEFWTEPAETPEQAKAKRDAAMARDPAAFARPTAAPVPRPGVRP